jgi:hypothetical protein
MGFNTTVVLFNDQISRWPEAINNAMCDWERWDIRERRKRSWDTSGRFGWGQVVAVEHADHDQVCVIGRNYGRYLTSVTQPERPEDLEVLAELLRCHGYAVRAPGEKRARPPAKWGFAATAAQEGGE